MSKSESAEALAPVWHGECGNDDCDHEVRRLIEGVYQPAEPDVWVRCAECGRITRLTDTEVDPDV